MENINRLDRLVYNLDKLSPSTLLMTVQPRKQMLRFAEPHLLIVPENKPGTTAIPNLCSLQPIVQTNEIVDRFMSQFVRTI